MYQETNVSYFIAIPILSIQNFFVLLPHRYRQPSRRVHKASLQCTKQAFPCFVRGPSLPPLGVYFGRILGGPRKGRNGLELYNLKNRVFLRLTSMDAELSFVMTSYGQVQKGSVVYDPFVGTGSIILLSCALRGAYCIGSDIDIRILKE